MHFTLSPMKMNNTNIFNNRKAGFLIFLVIAVLILVNYTFVLVNNSYTGDFLFVIPRLSGL
jgi:hypothetical protein